MKARLLLPILLLLGCQREEPAPSILSRSVVVGSGCTVWGCQSTVRITNGIHKGRTCSFNRAFTQGDTILVESNGLWCSLY